MKLRLAAFALFNCVTQNILGMLFPSKCVGCGKEGDDLCLVCLASSPPSEREGPGWIFPLYDYRHPPIKKALWLLKYKRRKNLAAVFANALHEKISEEISELATLKNFTSPILLPVPLSTRRLRERGFNQAEILCKEILKISESSEAVPNILELETGALIKWKDTGHQARIKNRSDRLKNVADSFRVTSDYKIKGRNIILVDDILTTGATLSEAKKILKRAGAKKIIAFTVAH